MCARGRIPFSLLISLALKKPSQEFHCVSFFVSLNEATIQPDLVDLPPSHILFGTQRPLNAGLRVVTNRSQRVSFAKSLR
jgi:hypothetical protein